MDATKKNYSKLSLKFFIALVLCLLVRLVPFRAPNVEPILATMMPFSRAYGALIGFSFATLSIFLYDVLTGTLGMQTFFTLGAYGILGLWAGHYFKKNKAKRWNYVSFAVMGTLVYDALTGLTVGPIFFHQSFLGSLLGQIPFTALHLVSNVALAFILSPAIYNLLIKNRPRELEEPEKKSTPYPSILNPKTI